ncbi:hypothetical protein Poli38472_000449 [Pythium oligandrum]|uniref:Uncharacterized protein n=1 Tax=Pythium oligandrum TaxID=41045 RepID=A0A8K1FI43_PYTOL|nr:hypothetical protein Poli38472_000449 [Pythium oligandrum]|eukprot:TMW60407.1 hypothetical protein Poli38472_000449 [Pythium oligandrum]
MSPSISSFFLPGESNPQPRDSLDLSGSIDQLQVALSMMDYTVSDAVDADHITFQLISSQHDVTFTSEAVLSVGITLAPPSFSIKWIDQVIHDGFVLSGVEDTAISLQSLSILTAPPTNSMLLNISLSADYGTLVLPLSATPMVPDALVVMDGLRAIVSGEFSSVVDNVKRLVYEPSRDYNGPDSIVISLMPVSSGNTTLWWFRETSTVLKLFIEPVMDPVSIFWTSTGVNHSVIMQTQPVTVLPRVIVRDPDAEAIEAFHRSRVWLRAVVSSSDLSLRHDAVATRTQATDRKAQTLAFEGRAQDLMALLSTVEMLPQLQPAETKAKEDSPRWLVRVDISKVNDEGNSIFSTSGLTLEVIPPRVTPQLFIPLRYQSVTLREDEAARIGDIFVLEDSSFQSFPVLVHLETESGNLSLSVNGEDVSARVFDFDVDSQSKLNELILGLWYNPAMEFCGTDHVELHVGSLSANLSIIVTAVNDPPELKFTSRFESRRLRWFAPTFQVIERDADDVLVLTVSISNARLVLRATTFDLAGLWVETFNASMLVIHGLAYGLSELFSTEALEIEPSNEEGSELTVCVKDAVAPSVCQDTKLTFPRVKDLVQVTDDKVVMRSEVDNTVSDFVQLSGEAEIDDSAIAKLRFTAREGIFVTAEDSLDSCEGESFNVRVLNKFHTLQGTWRCLRSLLQATWYRSPLLLPIDNARSERISVELLTDRERLLTHHDIGVWVLPPLQPFELTYASSTDEKLRPTWRWSTAERLLLTSVAKVTINATTPLAHDGLMLGLNVSCSSCLLSYSTQWIPGVSYVGAVSFSKGLRFVGPSTTLDRVIQTLELSFPSWNAKRHGDDVLTLALYQVSIATGRQVEGSWVSERVIPFVYELFNPPLRWREVRADFQLDPSTRIAAFDRLEVVGGVNSKTELNATLSIQCVDGPSVFVSALNPRLRLVDRDCQASSPPIEVSLPHHYIEDAVKSIQVKSSEGYSDRHVRMLLSLRDDDEVDTLEVTVAPIQSQRPSISAFTLQLAQSIENVSIGAVEDEVTSLVALQPFLNVLSSIQLDDHEVLEASLTVSHGSLLVPVSATGIHIKTGTTSSRRIEVEGTRETLAQALGKIEYSGDTDFDGDDALDITIQYADDDFDNDGAQLTGIRSAWRVPIHVASVNDAPVMRYRLLDTNTDNPRDAVVSLQVSDPDLKGDLDSLSTQIQVMLATSTGSFQLPGLDLDADDVLAEPVANSTTVWTNLSLTAALSSVNRILQRVVIHRQDSQELQTTCSNTEDLVVSVNDLAHSRSDWSEQVTRTIVSISTCAHQYGSNGDTNRLSLHWPKDHPHVDLDARRRVISVHGLTVDSVYQLPEEHDEIKIVGRTGFSADVEVQRVQLIPPPQTQVFAITMRATSGTIASVTGSFVLSTPTRSATVYADAVAMRVHELSQQTNSGRGLSESMEACLRSLYSDVLVASPAFHVIKRSTDTSFGLERVWNVYIELPQSSSPLQQPVLASSALTGASGIQVTVTSQVVASALSGVFRLRVGDEQTQELRVDATSLELQDALEALDAVDAVRVTTTPNSDPNTWDISFLFPSSEIPLLTANVSALIPQLVLSDAVSQFEIRPRAEARVNRMSEGHGLGTVYEIEIGATPFDPVYRIETSHAANLRSGTFRLGFRDVNAGTLLGETKDIAFDAVAMRRDEGTGQSQGGRRDESVESKLLRAMREMPRRPSGDALWDESAHIRPEVTRANGATTGTYVWIVTFIRAPTDWPALVISDATTVQLAQGSVRVTSTQATNPVGGTFTLEYDGVKSSPLPASASAAAVERELQQLSSVYFPEWSFGRVVVRRRELRRVGGSRFAVMLLEETASILPPDQNTHRLRVDGASLTGQGVFARVKTVCSRPQPGQFAIPAFSNALTGSHQGVFGAFDQPDVFKLRGSMHFLSPLLMQFTYDVPGDWYGHLRVLLRAEPSSPSSQPLGSASALSDVIYVSSLLPKIAVAFSTDRTDDDKTVLRGLPQSLAGAISLESEDYWKLVWLNVHTSVAYGQLTRRSDASVGASSLWLNGTLTSVRKQLASLIYISAPQSAHVVDILRVHVLYQTQDLSARELLLRVVEPPLKPFIRIVDSKEDPTNVDSWEITVRTVTEAISTPLRGIVIVDGNGRASESTYTSAQPIKFTARASFGRLYLADMVPLIPMVADNHTVNLHGTLSDVNSALESLQYESNLVIAHERDVITLFVERDESPSALSTYVNHRRSIQLLVDRVKPIPRVVTSPITYTSYEDAVFQFPDLRLESPQVMTPQLSRQRQSSQIWSTELLTPTQKFAFPRTKIDDPRHRWVNEFRESVHLTSRSSLVVNNVLIFAGNNPEHGEELWVSDGSTNGTRRFADLLPGPYGSSPSDFASLNGKVLFAAAGVDLSWMVRTGRECNRQRQSSVDSSLLYVVAQANVWDPNAVLDCPIGWHWATTERVVGLLRAKPREGSLSYVYWSQCDWQGFVFGGASRKYFRMADSKFTGALIHAGRRETESVEYDFTTSDFAGVVCVRKSTNGSAPSGRELWIADVRYPEQTVRLKDLRPGDSLGSNPRFLTPYLSQWIIFQATTDDFGSELFKTDGTSAGTVIVEDIWRGPRSSDPREFVEWPLGDGRMYFAATTDDGRELWSTDGFSSFTSERSRKQITGNSAVNIGTHLVGDICVGPGGSDPRFLTVMGIAGVFFSADDCIHGRELWMTTSSSTSGVKLVKDLNPTLGVGSDPTDLVVYGSKLYFVATADALIGRELYVSDGTGAGTTLLMDLAPGPASSTPSMLTVASAQSRVGGATVTTTRLYFYATDTLGRANLWRSDGTVGGTMSVWDDIFIQSHTLDRSAKSGIGFVVFQNALYYSLTYSPCSVTAELVSQDKYRLDTSVDIGRISAPGFVEAPSTSLSFVGGVSQLRNTLSSLAYHPPLNWHSTLAPKTSVVVHWHFAIISTDGSTPSETSVNLIVEPRRDAPVIQVDQVITYTTQSQSDYLSRLRLTCFPLTLDEDVPSKLQGFSIRSADEGHEQLWDIELSVQRGRLSLAHPQRRCIHNTRGGLTPRLLRFRATISCANRVFSAWTYTSDPNTSGDDTLRISIADPEDPRVGDSVLVPLVIREINDAPYALGATYYEGQEDVPLLITDWRVVDPDILSDREVSVEIQAQFGRVALLQTQGITLDSQTSTTSTLRFHGRLMNVNAALAEVVFASAADWNSLQNRDPISGEAYDRVTLRLSDGEAFNSSTTRVAYVYVAPMPDPVLISPPLTIRSVYASADTTVLRGDEDTWLTTESLGFTSVDDTTRTSLDVRFQVRYGRLAFGELEGVTINEDKTDSAGRSWRLRGRFSYVNQSVASLRYLADSEYYGSDALEILATAVDEDTMQQSISTSLTVPIEILAVNDAPEWALPSSSVRITQTTPTRVAGVRLTDVDVCPAATRCEYEVTIEALHALVTLPRLQVRKSPPQKVLSTTPTQQSALLILSGTLDELNDVLREIVVEMEVPTYYAASSLSRQTMEIWFTADDRGTWGLGGPQVTRRALLLSPVEWTTHRLTLSAPERVLTMQEDTTLVFRDDTAVTLRDDDVPRLAESQYEMTITTSHGHVTLRHSLGLMVVTNGSGLLVVRGFLPQLNNALNGSLYAPDQDWFGSEELTLSVREISDSSSVTQSVFIFVEPACDEPMWRTADKKAPTPSISLALDEDSQILIDTLTLTDPDLSEDLREITVRITASHGGIMLAATRGLVLRSGQFVDARPHLHGVDSNSDLWTNSRLFFAALDLTGRIADVNAALKGMIYRPEPDYHTSYRFEEAIRLEATASCGVADNEDESPRRIIVYTQIRPVPDPLRLESPLLTRISNRQLMTVSLQGTLSPASEAWEDEELALAPLPLVNVDKTEDQDTVVRMSVACRSCRVRPSITLTSLQRDYGILVTAYRGNNDATKGETEWMTTTSIVYYGSVPAINDGVLSRLVFQSAPEFHGNAVVLIRVGHHSSTSIDALETSYALVVRVKSRNDGPRVLTPRIEPTLEVNERSAVLIRGAPLEANVSTPPPPDSSPTWQLMRAIPSADDASTRFQILLDVRAFNPTQISSLVALDPTRALFRSYSLDTGDELWLTDGTAGGTRLLKDILPGADSASPSFLTSYSVDNRVYFAARGPHLAWRAPQEHRDQCDGIRASAFSPDIVYVVSESNTWDPDETYDCPVGYRWLSTAEAQASFLGHVALDGHVNEPLVYYDACGWQGYMWGGVRRVRFRFSDSRETGGFKHAGFRDSYRPDVDLVTQDFAGIVCRRMPISTDNGDYGWGVELWRTDGTADGTTLVARITPSSEGSHPSFITEFQSRLFFQATSPDYGSELWASDGTRKGTVLIADVAFGASGSAPEGLTVLQNSLLFFSATTEDFGRELWVSDGQQRMDFDHVEHGSSTNPVGTRLVLDIVPGAVSSQPRFIVALPAANLVLFQADDGTHGIELWCSDGSSGGTSLVMDVNPGAKGSNPSFLTHFQGKIFFQADDGVHGTELWVTDGTTVNTKLLIDLNTGAGNSHPRFLTVLSLAAQSVLVFAAQSDADRATELWQSDGTSAGTLKLFAGSREVVHVNENAMSLQTRSPFVSLGSNSFLYLGKKQETKANTRAIPSVLARSFTLVDADELVSHMMNYTATLEASMGRVSLTRECDDQVMPHEPSARIMITGDLETLNCALTEVVYHAGAIHESAWDAISLTITESAERTEVERVDEDDGRRFSTTASIPIHVLARNDAPIVTTPARFFAPVDQWTRILTNANVSDEDASNARLFVRLTTHVGRLRASGEAFNLEDAVIFTQNDDFMAVGVATLEFAASLSAINALLPKIEYGCLTRDACRVGANEYLSVYVDDNGFTGAGGAQMATRSVPIVVVAAAA